MGSNTTYSDVVNPLMNGFLTGQLQALLAYCSRSVFEDLTPRPDDPVWKKTKAKLTQFPNKTLLKRDLLFGGICSTASLGIFEILSKRLTKGKEGRPLSLTQEACCGLISGAIATFAWKPLGLAFTRVDPHKFSYINWLTALRHMVQNERASPSTLWRGSGLHIAGFMGMLASYDRSVDYLTQTQGLQKEKAQISASIVSGFFTAASVTSFHYLGMITKSVQGKKHGYRHIIPLICHALTPHSGCNFYVQFLRTFQGNAMMCLVQFSILEGVRRAELWPSRTLALHS